jgi:segregation and condensation protein B
MMEEDKQHEVVVPPGADEPAAQAVTEQPCAPGGQAGAQADPKPAAADSAVAPEEDADSQRLDDDGAPAAEPPDPAPGIEHAADENPAETPQDEAPADAGAFLLSAEQPATVAQADAATLQALVEAVVYVLPEPLPAAQIAAALNQPLENVQQALKRLLEETARPDRGVFVREVAGGYQAATKPEHHEAIRNFVKNLKQPLKLSNAALETLAVIAYKQPVTAPEILEIRGVQGVGVLKTLLERRLITTAGRKNVIGRPVLYKTTKEFLTQFGLKEVAELPTLKEFEEIRRQSFAEDDEVQQRTAPPAGPLVQAEAAEDLELDGAVQLEEAAATAPETLAEPAPATTTAEVSAPETQENGGEHDG